MLDFLGIGAQKAGTTWIYEQLSRHGGVEFPLGKESHYWDLVYGQRHVSAYMKIFEGEPGTIRGEITPAYATLDTFTIQLIQLVNADVKLFYVIRNPIDRAWSASLMELVNANGDYESTGDEWFVKEFRSDASLSRGDHVNNLKRWLGVFPRSQLSILRFDEISRDPRGLLKRLCRHIGADDGFFDHDPENALKRKVFSSNPPPIRPSLKPLLRNIYRDGIAELSGFLNEDLSAWIEP